MSLRVGTAVEDVLNARVGVFVFKLAPVIEYSKCNRTRPPLCSFEPRPRRFLYFTNDINFNDLSYLC